MENIRNHFCEGEIEAFKICNDIGQRNYRNSQRFKKEETYEPLECTVFLENQNRCFQFWSNVAERYSQKGIFEDRGGYPDKNAENIIKTELKSKNNLPYKEITKKYMETFKFENNYS